MKLILNYLKKHIVWVIITALIWILSVFLLIAPITVAIGDNKLDDGTFRYNLYSDAITNIGKLNSIKNVFNSKNIHYFNKGVVIFTLFYLTIIAIGIYKSRSKSEFDKIEHGSSDWCKNGEEYKVLSKNKGMVLATKEYLPLDKDGNTNVLIVGGSGSGKSSAYTIPNAYQKFGSYIFTDPKGEIYDTTAGYLKSQGYEIKLLNLVNPESSDCYNPLEHIKSELDVDVIASTIIKGQKSEVGSQDPYWDNMAELLIKSLIYYLISTRPKEEINLASCAEIVRLANASKDNDILKEKMDELPVNHPARRNYKSVSLASEKTFGTILSSAQSKLGKFDSKDIANVTSTNTIDFEEIATKKTALYVIASDTHSAYNFLLTIFFSQLIQQLYDFADRNGGKLPIPLFFILDEFSNIGQIPDFDKKISTSRSRGISFSVILQNLDQLKGLYEKSYETILGNCDTHLFLGSNSYSTVEYFSKELGEKTIFRDSETKNKDKNHKSSGSSNSEQILGRALLTPDELRRMPVDESIIFVRGLKPIKAKKYFYFKDKNMFDFFKKTEISHNEYRCESVGKWRIYNPEEPEYKEEKEEVDMSLDDLFTEETKENNYETLNNNIQNNQDINNIQSNQNINNIQQIQNVDQISSNIMKEDNNNINSNMKIENSNVESQDIDNSDFDLGEKLNEKFNELFGNIDD